MNDSIGVPVLVISHKDDHAHAVHALLRDAGHAAHCTRIAQLKELEPQLREGQPHLIFAFADEPDIDLEIISRVHAESAPSTPLLLVKNQVDEQTIVDAMALGARDVVSLENKQRLVAVAARELRAHQYETALEDVLSSADQYKNELHNLKQGVQEAIADVQEGIIVSVNPAWIELHGYESDEHLVGHPIMDLYRDADQATLKGALVACQKGKWDDSTVSLVARRNDDADFPVELKLETISFDGEDAIRMIVSTNRSETKTPESIIEQAVQKDPVTGFYHRHHFLLKAEAKISTMPEGGVRAIAYLRPDRFARVHSDIGLLGTEMLLTRLSQLLRDFMQPNDLYGRFGGTIFTIILERGTMDDVESWGEQVRKAVAAEVFEVKDKSTALTCSIGLCEIDSESIDLADILTEVEKACRAGRDQGGDAVQLSKTSGAAKEIRQADQLWSQRLRTALMENRLRLDHQPIASLNKDIENAFDTAVRLLDEEGNTVLASEFMPAAERAGLSIAIDRWVIGASFSFAAAKNPSLLFIRLSRDSVADTSLLDWLQKLIGETAAEPKTICFEVAEEVANQHLKAMKDLAQDLRKLGFKFAIDHFGKQQDSQQILNRVPMDFVKIDGSLMQGLHRDDGNQNTIRQLARAAKDLEIASIAERVQDANTMAVLWQLGISYIQGNYVQMTDIVMEDATQSAMPAQTESASA
ncbi:MAG: EAL domain-containing protein [Gammaproteobacteria bacterium]